MNTNCGNCQTEITRGYLCTDCRKALHAAKTARVAPIIAKREADKAARREAAINAFRYARSMGA